ncbi:MAG: ATP-binding protein [Gammaproteobacteria bacterium]|nr:ATP-binding protein [Gammaproteobacteria bacterium]
MMKETPIAAFDRELSIDDLLKGVNREKLLQALRSLLGESVCILNMAGDSVLGEYNDRIDSIRIPLTIQLEPVAYLQAGDSKVTHSATILVEQILKSAERYLMASNLHVEAVHADYEALQKKHEALMDSEEKYKALAQNLEQRVEEQVKTIENAQRQLYQAEKLASVGQLAAGIAHEINNPVGFITSNLATAQNYVSNIVKFSEQIQKELNGPVLKRVWDECDIEYMLQDFNELLKESVSGAERVAGIVSDLKDFSNVDRTEEATLNINQIIHSVCNVATNQIGQKAELELALGELPLTRCRPGHLAQVFLNILLNAVTAIKKAAGKIQIESGLINREIVIRVSDNGKGMSAEVMRRIFDPFYTTHDVGEGTGLGLTVSRDIIAAHNGTITVDSQEDTGTTFTIILPVKE